MNQRLQQLQQFPLPPSAVAFRTQDELADHLKSLEGVQWRPIGASREGWTLYGYKFGVGRNRVSIVAGSHADEPAGPMTAQMLPLILAQSFPDVMETYTFRVVPQINPDGAERNRPWFQPAPDLDSYVAKAVREKPGDDIEFGFGDGEGVRPECAAAMDFLREGAPYAAHFSLHGMAVSEGAWFLLDPDHAGRADTLMENLIELCRAMNLPLRDVDRKGEKGFSRIRPGFSTTPNSLAMRDFFLERDDKTTAALFRPSSMEFIKSLGGDPLCMVSEMALFQIGDSACSYESVKDRLLAARAESAKEKVQALAVDCDITPVPFETAVRMQIAMMVLALDYIASESG